MFHAHNEILPGVGVGDLAAVRIGGVSIDLDELIAQGALIEEVFGPDGPFTVHLSGAIFPAETNHTGTASLVPVLHRGVQGTVQTNVGWAATAKDGRDSILHVEGGGVVREGAIACGASCTEVLGNVVAYFRRTSRATRGVDSSHWWLGVWFVGSSTQRVLGWKVRKQRDEE